MVFILYVAIVDTWEKISIGQVWFPDQHLVATTNEHVYNDKYTTYRQLVGL